jgi:hypothetical protein
MTRQHRADSFMEAVTNQAVGFIIAMATYVFIINPLFDLKSSAAESFWITSIFTAISVIRGYVIRRLFDGKTIYAGLKDWHRRKRSTNS